MKERLYRIWTNVGRSNISQNAQINF